MIGKVNILSGTASTFGRSHGNTLPIVARPFGMAHWSMQTRSAAGFFFHAEDSTVQGIRLTHQPSPWMDDYGALVLMPQAGPLLIPADERSSCIRPEDSVLGPDHMKLRLWRYQIGCEMVPSDRGALFALEYSGEGGANRLILEPPKGESRATVLMSERRVVGFTRGNSGGVPGNFACYYAMEFSQPVARAGTFVEGRLIEGLEASGERAGAFVEFSGRSVEVRIATSFISIEQARTNLERELAGQHMASLRRESSEAWQEVLGRIRVETGNEEWLRTFYSCLYRCFLFPRVFHEIDPSGAMVHYSPCDGSVHDGPFYTDTGFWDTYRTQFPLLNLLDRPRSGEMMEGFLNGYREGGWLSQWSSPGPRGIMIGTHSEAVFAHAIASGIPGFDREVAYAAMRRDCLEAPDRSEVGRAGLRDYHELGFVPADSIRQSASMTLDYAYDDHCAATVADLLGHKEDAALLHRRAKNYRNVWNPEVGFMCGRNRDGSWAPFHPYEWGGPYVEGGAWQSSWAVPHDPEGLIALLGGREGCLKKLDALLETPPYFQTGTYGREIHEMTEMAQADFGQYAHSNQPVHGVLWLYTLAGAPERNRAAVRRVLTELYGSGLRGFCGDEDNGEMSAWFVFSALGLFPFCPGSGRLVTGGLLFDRAVIRPADGPEIAVEPLRGGGVPQFDSRPLPGFEIEIASLLQGGLLQVPAL